ncbi:MAG: RNA polymerase sigma factor SigZ [Sedimentibacter sp.]
MRELSETEYFENIWNKYSIQLKNYIKKRVRNNQDVDDILQNVFCKISVSIYSLKDADKFQSWIYAIARNSIIDFYRTQRYEYMYDLPDDIIDETEDKSNENEEIAQCVKSMITDLPEKYKDAIILTGFQNFTQKELSIRAGLSESGAKSRVQRARAKLKDTLLNCCQLEFDHFGNIISYNHKSSTCKYC